MAKGVAALAFRGAKKLFPPNAAGNLGVRRRKFEIAPKPEQSWAFGGVRFKIAPKPRRLWAYSGQDMK